MSSFKHVLLLHGFGGHADAWNACIKSLPTHLHVHAPCLPGHGGAPVCAGFEETLTTLVQHIPAQEPFAVVGYSLGGRLAYAMAARYPHRVRALLAVGAHPGLSHTDTQERLNRVHTDACWADVLRTQGVQVFFKQWRTQALFHTQKTLDPAVLQQQEQWQMRHTPQDLACMMERFSLGLMPCYTPMLAQLNIPVHLGVGAEDAKYVAVLHALCGVLKQGRLLKAQGAGHNVLLEQPSTVAQWICNL